MNSSHYFCNTYVGFGKKKSQNRILIDDFLTILNKFPLNYFKNYANFKQTSALSTQELPQTFYQINNIPFLHPWNPIRNLFLVFIVLQISPAIALILDYFQEILYLKCCYVITSHMATWLSCTIYVYELKGLSASERERKAS